MESSWQPITNAGHGDLEPMALAPSGDWQGLQGGQKNMGSLWNCQQIQLTPAIVGWFSQYHFQATFWITFHSNSDSFLVFFFSQEKIKQTVPPNHCLEKLLARSETGFQVRVGDVFSCCTKPTIFLEHQNDQWFVKGRSTTVYPSEGWTYTFVASSGFLASNGCKVSAKPGSCLGETCRSGLSCKGCLESGRNRHRWRIPYYVCIYLLRISWDRIIQGSCCGITTRKKVTKQPLFYFGWTRNLSRGEVLWKILPNSPKSGKLFEIVKEIGFRDRHFNIHRFFFPQKMARWSNLTRFFNWLANMAISNYTMNEDEFPIEYVDFLLLCKCTWDS